MNNLIMKIISGLDIPSNPDYVPVSITAEIHKSAISDSSLIEEKVKYSDSLTTIPFDYIPKPDEVVYGRLKIHFRNNTDTGWSSLAILDTKTNEMTMNTNVIVTPKVIVDPSFTDRGLIKVLTSDYKIYAGIGSHKYTSWYVRSLDGGIVWKREKDEDNLTSIILPSNIFTSKKAYSIIAVHGNEFDNKSLEGKLTLTTNGEDIGQGSIGGKFIVEVTNDAIWELYNKFDDTKRMKFDLGQLDPNKKVVLTIPNKSGTLVYEEDLKRIESSITPKVIALG